MKDLKCNFCGSRSTFPLYSLKDWQTHQGGNFTLVRCQECGLLYLSPQLSWEELKLYYPDDYMPYVLTDKLSRNYFLKLVRKFGWRNRRKAIERKCAGGRLLDVGCATGEFITEMEASQNWECYGVEPVSYAASVAKLNTKVRIVEGTLEEAKYPSDFFDVVTLWDVLEHTSDPLGIIREARRILKPDGILIVGVPDPESILARWFGAYWIGLDAPRHLHGFPKSTITRRLRLENFRKVEIAYLFSDHVSIWGSLAVLSFEKGNSMLGQRLEKIAQSQWARLMFSGFYIVARWLKIGSSPTYFAWK